MAVRDTLVGAINSHLRQVPPLYRSEAVEMQSLDIAITAASTESIIDLLDEQVASWYAMRFPSRPGMSITREPWEERYLQDKAPLWRKGDPSALRTLGGTRVDRVRWYVHLKADNPWVPLAWQIHPEDNAQLPPSSHVEEGKGSISSSLDPAHVLRKLTAEEYHDDPSWLDIVLSRASIPRCVVVGPAGTGKTVLLQHFAWVIATDDEPIIPSDPVHRISRIGVRGESPIPPIPILHNATTLIAHLREHRPIREALAALLHSAETFGELADGLAVRAGIDAGRYVFLIDSLDEVPRREDREALVAALGTLQGPSPRVILTTRPSPHTAVELPDGFMRVDIAPLDEDATRRLVQAWISCWAPGEDFEDVMRAVDSVRHNFPSGADERSPVENPMLLSCILLIYATYRRLPDDVAKLYYDMVRVLCEAKIRAADDHDRDTVAERYREALRELSFASQELGGTQLRITDAHELLIERKFISRGAAENWLRMLANHTGLVRFDDASAQAVIRPWHRSYQEYLTAEAIALAYANRAGDCVAWLREERPGRGTRLSDPAWRGTLRFLIGAAVHQNRTWGLNLIEALAASAHTRTRDQGRLHVIAVEGTAEYANSLFQNEALCQTLPAAVVHAFNADGNGWPIDDRLDTLDALGRLGDPRLSDPQRRDRNDADSGWAEVPAGVYRVGTDHPLEPHLSIRGGSLHDGTGSALPLTQQETDGFWIRRWPVTVAELPSGATRRAQSSL